jgi:hypothetical protein
MPARVVLSANLAPYRLENDMVYWNFELYHLERVEDRLYCMSARYLVDAWT